ncbi:MAG: hypothetical protein ACE5NG_16925, partial [bacterium]
MKTSILIAVLTLIFVTAALAQSPANVEKAVRFRAPQSNAPVMVQSESQTLNSKKVDNSIDLNAVEHRSTAQLQELGTRYANGWGENAAQLKELGTRYANGWGENAAQLKELGTRY